MKNFLLLLIVAILLCLNPAYAQKGSDKNVLLYLQVTELEEDGKYAEASDVVKTMLKNEPSSFLYQKLCELLLQQNKADEVLNILAEATKHYPEEPYFQMLFGQLYEFHKLEPKTAYRYYIKASKLSDDPQYLQAATRVMESIEEYDVAIKHITELIKRDTANADYYAERGRIYRSKGDTKNAIKDLNLSLEIDENLTAMLLLADIYLVDGDNEKAKEMLERISSINNNMIIPELKLGDIYQSEKDYSKAIEIFSEVANKLSGKDRASVLKQIAAIYYDMGDYENAAKTFEWVLELTPDDTRSAYFAGFMYEYIGNIDKARMIYDNAIAINSDYALLLKRAALIAVRDEEYDKAIKYLNNIDPIEYDVEYYLIMAEALSDKNEHEKALLVLIDGLNNNPTDEDILYSLALQYEYVGERDNAIKTAITGLESNANSHMLMNFIGYLYADMNINLDEAYDLISKALAQEPENAAYLDSLGWYYYRVKDYDKAYEYISKAYKLSPHDEIKDHMIEIEKVLKK